MHVQLRLTMVRPSEKRDIGPDSDSSTNSELTRTFEATARARGATIYSLDVRHIEPSEAVRMKCQAPLCEYYGACKTCPPYISSVSEFKAALRDYRQAFLMVVQEDVKDLETYRTDFTAERKLLDLISELEAAAFENGCYLAMGLVVGGCKLCKQCTPPGEPCRHPYKARPSPEGLGIDITALARRAGVPLEWPPREKIHFVGLLLL